MYVYKMTNLLNGKIYVGLSTVDTPYNKRNYYGSGHLIKRAIKKHGKKAFKKEIVFETNDLEELKNYEKDMIYELQTNNEMYNIAEGGQTGHWMKFKSEEEIKSIREKIRQSLLEYYKENDSSTKGMKFDYGPRISEALRGRKQPRDLVERRNKSNTGKRRTKEQKENISSAIKEAYKDGFSKEHKAKISKALTGRSLSKSHKEKLKKQKPEIVCPHCGKLGRGPVMYRHHFDNCKILKN